MFYFLAIELFYYYITNKQKMNIKNNLVIKKFYCYKYINYIKKVNIK